MENWGLVTYQETFLLVDPENTDEVSKQFAAIIISKLGTYYYTLIYIVCLLPIPISF